MTYYLRVCPVCGQRYVWSPDFPAAESMQYCSPECDRLVNKYHVQSVAVPSRVPVYCDKCVQGYD
jgi:hypothetical protein